MPFGSKFLSFFTSQFLFFIKQFHSFAWWSGLATFYDCHHSIEQRVRPRINWKIIINNVCIVHFSFEIIFHIENDFNLFVDCKREKTRASWLIHWIEWEKLDKKNCCSSRFVIRVCVKNRCRLYFGRRKLLWRRTHASQLQHNRIDRGKRSFHVLRHHGLRLLNESMCITFTSYPFAAHHKFFSNRFVKLHHVRTVCSFSIDGDTQNKKIALKMLHHSSHRLNSCSNVNRAVTQLTKRRKTNSLFICNGFFIWFRFVRIFDIASRSIFDEFIKSL